MTLSNLTRGIGAKDIVNRSGKEPEVHDDIRDLEDNVKARHDFLFGVRGRQEKKRKNVGYLARHVPWPY